jgi:cytochrome c oxidase subunit 2
MGMKFVVLIVIVLVVIAVAQIMRVYELSASIRGKREEDIDIRTNKINGSLMLVFLLVFFGSFFYMLAAYGRGMLPNAASESGLEIDWLYNINWVIVFLIFLITNALLFIFAWKYSYDPNRKAHWFPHDNKLEMIWTVVPAGVLAVIIILGLMTWNDITGAPSDDAKIVEIYGKQFDWTARYSGDDNKLGYADYKLVSSVEDHNNALGVVTKNTIQWKVYELNKNIDAIYQSLENEANGLVVFSEANLSTMIAKVERLERLKERVIQMNEMYSDSIDVYAQDDFTSKELFLIVDQEYQFILRSQDVLHSAYFPHFRAQMNCVPGMRTTLKFKPILTTAEIREREQNPDFNYILMCNKICGVSHSNMKMPVYVGPAEEFETWKMLSEGNIAMAVNDTIIAPEVDMTPAAPLISGGHSDDSHVEEAHH